MRLVVKVGTSILAHDTGMLNIRRVEKLCEVLSDIRSSGIDLVFVTSGAIGVGQGKLAMEERPVDVPMVQAAAAVGQCELMYTYDKMFHAYDHVAAQVLISETDLKDEERKNNFINTMTVLMELGAIPVINENDTVSTQECMNTVGDNDVLSAVIANEINADMLIILSNVNGLYDSNPLKNPDAQVLSVVNNIGPRHYAAAEGIISKIGPGGMYSKVKAADIATEKGCTVVIANGRNPEILYDILDGLDRGTKFLPKQTL